MLEDNSSSTKCFNFLQSANTTTSRSLISASVSGASLAQLAQHGSESSNGESRVAFNRRPISDTDSNIIAPAGKIADQTRERNYYSSTVMTWAAQHAIDCTIPIMPWYGTTIYNPLWTMGQQQQQQQGTRVIR
jgi:hypothetical protein